MDRDTRDMLLETADRFFTERCGKEVVNGVEKGAWPADLWKEIEEMGLPLIAVPEDKGGVGGTLADMLALLRLAGSHAVPVPLAETALANLLMATAGGEPKPGPATLALGNLQLSGGRLSGKVERVPFASVADRFIAVVGGTLAVVARANARIEAKPSQAGERRARVRAGGRHARHADGGRGRQGAGDRRRIFQAARAVRPVDLDLPGHPAHAGRAGELRGRHHRLGRSGGA